VKSSSPALHLFFWGALLFAAPFAPVQAQTTPDPLFKTIQPLDALLFDAYNRCDLKHSRPCGRQPGALSRPGKWLQGG
jgi:hypothetical protein